MRCKTKCGISGKWFLASALLTASCKTLSAAELPWPITLRQQMQRTTDASCRIGIVAEPLCAASGAAAGIGLDFIEADAADDRTVVADLLKMSNYLQRATVAAGSPALQCGLQSGDELRLMDSTR
ncbi:hypothetical protein [Novosphingobium resinovorum]|uniref:hypothetical protein n=1 Tax=Novosphingobium resinovorum TaxID=158500 RepID=UPI0012DDE74D|nr:hypothetical protein [Novosphingobium resinovorum]